MLAVHQSDVPQNSLFHESKRDPSTSGCFLSEKEMKQDKNLNIVDEAFDGNKNWNQVRTRGDEKAGSPESTSPDDNVVLPIQRPKRRLKDLSQAMRSEGIGLSSEEEVRSPPEGAEVRIVEEHERGEGTVRACEEWAGSPMEDNGYASSSLSIDSPDSVSGNTWDLPAATHGNEPEPITEHPEPVDADVEASSDSDAYSPSLVEALQNLQDKEKLKRLEKEKHQVHLTMYRRLALLQWIRGLQQKVVDQQNRLQESFDTILDNRKELLRYIQHGVGCPKETSTQAM
ncbi:UPF0500 protein C1orf216 homolog [Ambystoma mexicanum]|uniref:UPF0500 protein C1orf216 homolog n=1 Tax=Ambystoma mexicanum TaxID=8296 RepID=UPI0037E8DE27